MLQHYFWRFKATYISWFGCFNFKIYLLSIMIFRLLNLLYFFWTFKFVILSSLWLSFKNNDNNNNKLYLLYFLFTTKLRSSTKVVSPLSLRMHTDIILVKCTINILNIKIITVENYSYEVIEVKIFLKPQ